jgi:RNA polymerase sigma-70 factor (ECF subfamily)
MKVSAVGHPDKGVLEKPSRSEGPGRLETQTQAQGAGVSKAAPNDFAAIYDTWFEEVSRWVRALGGQDADRDDIVQEVFLVVRRRLGAFDGTNLSGWLYRITRRQVRDFRRRSWVKHIFTKRRVENPDELADDVKGPAAAAEQGENRRILQTILDRIPENRRSAFVLFEIEGLSGEEIARVQGIPVNTVWTRLHVARKEFLALAAKYQKRQLVERHEDHEDEQATGGDRPDGGRR